MWVRESCSMHPLLLCPCPQLCNHKRPSRCWIHHDRAGLLFPYHWGSWLTELLFLELLGWRTWAYLLWEKQWHGGYGNSRWEASPTLVGNILLLLRLFILGDPDNLASTLLGGGTGRLSLCRVTYQFNKHIKMHASLFACEPSTHIISLPYKTDFIEQEKSWDNSIL